MSLGKGPGFLLSRETRTDLSAVDPDYPIEVESRAKAVCSVFRLMRGSVREGARGTRLMI